MKISPQQVQLISRLYQEQRQQGPKRTGPKGQGGRDKVTIYQVSQDIQAAMAKLETLPEIREEKIAELRAAIEQGTYEVSARDVAEKILDRLLVDEMLRDEG